MSKPIVFISHITEEKEMAIELKNLIEESFLGMFEVFVSSDENSIASGSRWLDNISNALGKCVVELILCSPKSVKRPWINFEAGAGWVREIDVIPVCHSGMEPSKLPIPLNMLQGVRISELSSAKLIMPVLANAIGAKCPRINLDDFIEQMKQLEEKYTFWNDINRSLKEFSAKYQDLFEKLKYQNALEKKLNDFDIKELIDLLRPLISRGWVSVRRTGNASITNGIQWLYGIEIVVTDKYKELFQNENCVFYKK